ncbi:glutathione S-transferase family protein [Paraburkholderia edwinii]|jgi:glutathione S-transferase|uniref:Glutathione S-transferase family protein n=1 Tax=Paraburkholderia edwinii TaxID=2861782 RepID=A0ABX8UX74_9BURK|nr:glutathione S-transferase family protein [Paraburkholderia edwinii]QYD73605.1 glutathione S-transferase family protein [Paraburkholderia edwinii]
MQIKRLKLYHSPALRSTRVKWLLHEILGDDFDVESIDAYSDLYTPEFRKLNPNHALPVLEITLENNETVVMIESGAMLVMLADLFPASRLAPLARPFSKERADYLQMLHFLCTSMDMMLWQLRIHEHVLPASERDDRTIRRYRRKIAEEVEPQLAKRLRETPYICGAAFTAADCVMGYNLMWSRGAGLCTAPVFTDYLARMAARPAYVSAFADRHLFVRTVPEDAPVKVQFTG